MLTSACGVRMSREYNNNLSLWNVSLILIMVWLLSFIQVTSAMSFRANSLTVYALNANGLVHLGKISHINSAINTRRPHLFVISETKTNLKMGDKLPKGDDETTYRLCT